MNQGNRPQPLHNLPSSSVVKWRKYKTKGYLHFDERMHIGHMKANLLNEDWIASYAFLPFIHFKKGFKIFRRIKKLIVRDK